MIFQMKEVNNSHIQALGEGQIKYKGQWYRESFILFNEEIITSWSHPEVKNLKIDDFKFALDSECELIVLGTGLNQVFPDRYLLTEILKRGKGIEVMDTKSACRTYNVISSEYRSVVAMLMIG